MEYYILENKKAVLVKDVLEWARKFEIQDRRVAQDKIKNISISTVFLGVDHGFGSIRPLLFETMVFGGELDQEMVRYTTWQEAETGHKMMVERVKERLTKDLKNG